MSRRDSEETETSRSRTLNRRTVVKTVGATAAAGAAFAGTASAWRDFGVFFCGCGQVVIKARHGDLTIGEFTVTMYKEGKGGGCTTATATPENEDFLRFVQQGRGKILAITVEGLNDPSVEGTYCNPNTCAQKRLDKCDVDCDYTGTKGHCGPPNDGNG